MKAHYRVTLKIDPELYEAWKKHVRLIYGISPSGAHGGIMQKNTEVFCDAIRGLMRHEKDNTRKA